MSALKRPGIWDKKATPIIQGEEELSIDHDNNQKTVITAKRLDPEDTSNSGDRESSGLVSEDTIPQAIQDTSVLVNQETDRPVVQEVIHQNAQESESLSRKTPKSRNGKVSKGQNAEKLDSQSPDSLDAKPLRGGTPNQPDAIPQDADPSNLQVNQPPNQQSDDAAKQQIGETTKRKKAKSATLVKKTYYIDPDIDGAIELMAILQKGDQSDIVRQLLRSAIPEYYLTQWKAMRDHSK